MARPKFATQTPTACRYLKASGRYFARHIAVTQRAHGTCEGNPPARAHQRLGSKLRQSSIEPAVADDCYLVSRARESLTS
jgi:hypothetical protein